MRKLFIMVIKNFHPINYLTSAAQSHMDQKIKDVRCIWNGIKVTLKKLGLDKENKEKEVAQRSLCEMPSLSMDPSRLSTTSSLAAEQLEEDVSPQESETAASFEDLDKQINGGRRPRLVTSEHMQKAVDYIEEHQAELDRRLKDSGCDYIVLQKGEANVPYSIEYHGEGQAFLRYQKDYTEGGFKVISKMVDLSRKQLLVKKR